MKIAPEFLLLMAIGDAYGMKYEFVPHAQNITTADLAYGPHPKHTAYCQGDYTDDTQMALAIAELLIERSSSLSSLTETDFVEIWLEAFRRDPHVGYSKYMFKVISESQTADEFIDSLDPTLGVTSGAAMRAGPIGLLPDVADVIYLTKMQAKITHDTPAGVNSALAVALTVHFLHHGGARDKLDAFLEKHIGKGWDSAANGYSEDPHNGLKSVVQAIKAMRNAKTLSEVLLTAVNQEALSDTDTVCSLAMIMASRCSEIKNDLPPALYDGLESGVYGVDYLRDIDDKADKLFPPSAVYKKINPPLKPTRKWFYP